MPFTSAHRISTLSFIWKPERSDLSVTAQVTGVPEPSPSSSPSPAPETVMLVSVSCVIVPLASTLPCSPSFSSSVRIERSVNAPVVASTETSSSISSPGLSAGSWKPLGTVTKTSPRCSTASRSWSPFRPRKIPSSSRLFE